MKSMKMRWHGGDEKYVQNFGRKVLSEETIRNTAVYGRII
jgi:hypothetical protein